MNTAVASADAECIKVGQIEIRYLVGGTTGATLGAFEMRVPPHSNVPPPHSHADNDEWIYVLEGTLRYAVDDITRELRPGDSMFTPRGSVHAFSNPHDAPAVALTVLTPDIGAEYFREVRDVLGAGGPPDKARLVAVMARYGLAVSAPH